MGLATAFFLAAFVTAACGQAELFPYGTDRGDQELSDCDDCNSGVVSLQYNVQMYGINQSSYAVHSNGYITFPSGSVVNSYSYDPSPLDQIRGDPMIAPFWADADLRGSGTVYYRESCNTSELSRAADLVHIVYQECQELSSLVVVTWEDDGYFNNHTDKLNTYQMVVATGGIPVKSYAIFLFESIQWTTGDNSNDTDGLGGNRAQVGHCSGDGRDSMTLPGSSTPDLLYLPFMSNTDCPGIFVSCLQSGEAVRKLVYEQQNPTSRTVYEQQDKTMPTSRMVYEQQDKTPPTSRMVYEQQKPTSRMVYEQQDKTMPTSRTVYEQQDKTPPTSRMVYEQASSKMVYQNTNDCPGINGPSLVVHEQQQGK